MQATDVIWLALLAGAGALEAWGIWLNRRRPPSSDHTFTDLVRRIFRVDTLAGRVVFIAAWLGFAAWVVYHIVFED